MAPLDLTDNDVFEKFFKENFPSICVWCRYKFNLDHEEAKEVVHAGFIKIWENRQLISPQLSVKGYLYKIITNICLESRRHQKVKDKYASFISSRFTENIDNDTYENFDIKQLEQIIAETLDQMPEQMRIIFELSRNAGLKYAEIAKKQQISIKTVETQMSRALARLRSTLGRFMLLLLFIYFFLWL